MKPYSLRGKAMPESLNSFLFSTPEMTRVFSPQSQLRAMMRFEWALMQALESNGLAAKGASQILGTLLEQDFINIESLQREAADAGNIVIPFVRQLTAAVKERDESASRAIHLGATSQDVLDTALVIQMHEALPLLDEAIVRLDTALVRQVRTHAETVLSGRTWLQPGPPTTLGLKLAGTLAALRRARVRLHSAAQRALVLQFGGAVGTLAALGDAGQFVSTELARLLDLPQPELPWHTQRDRLVEIVQVLAVLTGTLAKFARDVALLMQAEVAEVSEGVDNGRGGSSTMPHKHNPVGCAAVLAIHTRMPALTSTMLHAMPQEHERGLGLWQAEWETVPEAFRLAAAALSYSIDVAESLQVDAVRMQANIDHLMGATMSEAVSAVLAPKIGLAAAHKLLREATARSQSEHRHLGDVLKQSPELLEQIDVREFDRLMDRHHYLGSAQRFIAAVLGDEHARD
jgi:3-carboxy-cis,cis-muconate cycloisomerase